MEPDQKRNAGWFHRVKVFVTVFKFQVSDRGRKADQGLASRELVTEAQAAYPKKGCLGDRLARRVTIRQVPQMDQPGTAGDK